MWFLGTPSSELQINFGVLQIDTENSAAGPKFYTKRNHIFWDKQNQYTILLWKFTHVILSSRLIINLIYNIPSSQKKFLLSLAWTVSVDTQKWCNYLSSVRNSGATKCQMLLEGKSFKWCAYHITNLATVTI